MMKCEEASRLSSEGLDRELSFSERFALRLHLALCKVCRTITGQISMMRRITTAAGKATSDSGLLSRDTFDESLSTDAKTRMKRALTPENS